MIDFDRILSIVEAFNREGGEYKVFGGVAVNLHGIPRTTEDVDFFVDRAGECRPDQACVALDLG